jgi:hypothetical protein
MMTECAGRLTPHARVAVHTNTLMMPSANIFSTMFRSERRIPALWHENPPANINNNNIYFVLILKI